MGSDSYQNLPKWKNYEQILRNYPLFVYSRPKHEVRNPAAGVEILEAPLLEISATHIRKTLRDGKSIRYLVPEKVAEEIDKNRYYR